MTSRTRLGGTAVTMGRHPIPGSLCGVSDTGPSAACNCPGVPVSDGETSGPPHPTPDEVRALLRECVTRVRPGEVLVIRVPYDTPWDKARSYQQVLDAARETWGIRAVVVTAEELGVIPEAGDEAFDKRVLAAINRLDVRAEVRNGAGVPVHAEPGCAWVGESVR